MLENFITGKKALFADGVHTELRVQENRSRRIMLAQGNLTANSRSEVSGVSARVYRNGVYGFSSMAGCSSAAAETVLKAAAENALFMDRHIRKGREAFPALPTGQIPAGKVIADIGSKNFNADTCSGKLDELAAVYKPLMDDYYTRFFGKDSWHTRQFDDTVSSVKEFLRQRYASIINKIPKQ